MRVICIRDVVVSGRRVFTKGEEYRFTDIYENGKVTSMEATGDCGVGVWGRKEASFKKHFTDISKMSKRKLNKLKEELCK